MRLSAIRAYLVKNFKPVSTGRSLQGMKNLEWAFIAVCSLGVPITLLMAWLHHPVSYTAMIATAVLLALSSIIATFLNCGIKSLARHRTQDPPRSCHGNLYTPKASQFARCRRESPIRQNDQAAIRSGNQRSHL